MKCICRPSAWYPGPYRVEGTTYRYFRPNCLLQGQQAHVQHPLGHRVREQAGDRLAQPDSSPPSSGSSRRRRSSCPMQISLACGCWSAPPVQHVRVDPLVDHPLLARVVKAEVAGLGPGREVKDLLVVQCG